VCANSSGLAANAALPPLNLTVNVGAGTPGSLTNTVIVSHAGDKNDVNDRSSETAIVTNKPVTTTTLAASVNPSTAGQPVTFTATVSSDAGTPTGTIAFFDGNVSLGTGNLSGGTATLMTSALTVGAHSLNAFYSGDDTFAYSNSSSISQTVMLANKFATATALVSSLNPSKLGEQVNFTANVTSGEGTPTGNVEFFDGATSLGVRSLSNGSATFSTSALLVGTHPITAQYLSDPSFNASVSPALPQVVTQTDPGIPYAPDTVFSDQKAGSVLVYNLYTSNTSTPALQNTEVSITNTHPTSSISVQFYFVNGATGQASQTSISLAPTQTKSLLASEVDPGKTGYIVAVAVDSVTACPKSFNYLIGDAYIKLSTGHNASLGAEAFAAIADPPAACSSTSTITLNFDGVSYDMAPRELSINNITSGSGATMLVINRLGGDLSAGGSAATIGPVTGTLFNDTENGFTFSFTGGVQILNSLSNSFPVTAPPFNIVIPSGRTGWMKFRATDDVPLLGAAIRFNGGGNNLDALTLTKTGSILLRETTPDLSISKIAVGDFTACSTGNYTITVTNAINASAATGVITVTDTLPGNLTLAGFSGSGWSCVVPSARIDTANVICTNSSGLAPGASLPNLTLTVNVGPGTPTGARSITNTAVVSIAPDREINLDNNSSSAQTNVNKLVTTTAIVASVNPSVCGQTVTFTAQVSSAVACSSSPTGTVTFSDRGTTLGVGTLNAAGQATFSISSLAVESHLITASYSGDNNYSPSDSPALTHTVNKASSAIAVTSSSSTVFLGQPVTLTAQVNPVAPSSGTPAGTVQFLDNGVAIGSPVTLSGGSASLTTSALTVGAHNITASYSGDSCFAAATTPTALTVTVLAAPDLQVTAINAPSLVYTDSAFDLSWSDKNEGGLRAVGPWTDKVFLSVDNQPGNDTLLAEFPFAQSLDPGQSAARTQLISIPRSAVPSDGGYFLIVITDANNNVDEKSFENNNFRAIPITVRKPPLPDLVVQAIEAPATAFFDQTITVRWTVKNIGQGSTNATGWTDWVYLSSDNIPEIEDPFKLPVQNFSYLAAGEGYVASADIRIPRGLIGTYNVLVYTDFDGTNHRGLPFNVIEENEANNYDKLKVINISAPPVPDLQVSLVQAPEEGFAGQPTPINWRVENRGTGNTPPDQAAWFDGIYLSKETNFNPATARFIGSLKHEGGLEKDGGYLVSGFSVNLPTDIAGDWYVFVITDYLDNIYEFTGENNNRNYDQRRPMRIRATPPDLIVTSLTAPTSGAAGNQITVNWTVRNQGAFEAGPNWFDTVYISNTNTLDPVTATPLQTIYRSSSLGPGGTYSASANATIPSCASGVYYLFVYTDSRNQIFEFDPNLDAEKNNFSEAKAIQIASIPPDLQVVSVTNPATGNAGQTVSVSWVVENRGASPAGPDAWVDRVYLNPSPTFDLNTALLLGSFTHNGSLAVNASYLQTQNALIPTTAAGSYYVFVLTDALDSVEECGQENNNAGVGAVIINVANNAPDLTISGVTAPNNVFAGQTVTVRWTGNNIGAVAAPNNAWNDGVYLSNNQTLDALDNRIATKLVNGPLNAGSSYQAQAQALIPPVSAGVYYLIVNADADNFVFEAQREDNNTNYLKVTGSGLKNRPKPRQ
jgi:hypothetical protein